MDDLLLHQALESLQSSSMLLILLLLIFFFIVLFMSRPKLPYPSALKRVQFHYYKWRQIPTGNGVGEIRSSSIVSPQ
ncbi:hypothetical protein L3X38_043227 [Prunus dulcis]|uniref:Uncharacterized protein n=1 Tax=Prunus dulcis TaxID=3755 RepID=A0AAD4UXR5_PRUDU|nr:hypothetical protein L3X38_043227 [Prunus dulcis]